MVAQLTTAIYAHLLMNVPSVRKAIYHLKAIAYFAKWKTVQVALSKISAIPVEMALYKLMESANLCVM